YDVNPKPAHAYEAGSRTHFVALPFNEGSKSTPRMRIRVYSSVDPTDVASWSHVSMPAVNDTDQHWHQWLAAGPLPLTPGSEFAFGHVFVNWLSNDTNDVVRAQGAISRDNGATYSGTP